VVVADRRRSDCVADFRSDAGFYQAFAGWAARHVIFAELCHTDDVPNPVNSLT
jgi:hypothetical protein